LIYFLILQFTIFDESINTNPMKKKKGLFPSFLPLVITLCLYLVFYNRIECKPGHVSFWFIFVLGMALGVVITRLRMWFSDLKE